MVFNLNKIRKKFIISIAIFILISGHIYGQGSDVYKLINIDSVLHTPVILPDYNAYRIRDCQFIVHYTGEIRMMDQGKVSRFEQLNQLHPEAKLHFTNTDAVIKTKGDRELLMGLKDGLAADKLKPYDQPKDLKIKVKMIEGNFKAEKVVGLYYNNIIYRDFVIQDIEAVKN